MTQKLVKRRQLMSQRDGDEEVSGEDFFSGESESEGQESDDEDESPASAGVIEKISLKNFMCHDFFELTLGPQINFIIGRNGSGKSAILTGISVGLGAKATDTNRGKSIRELVKDGKSTARVTIVFLNKGSEAFKPEVYGKRIIIERKIQRVGTSSYTIKSESGTVISNKKATLDEMLYKFSITVDNPLAFLSQDKAREFLTSTTDKIKYDYFMAGAYINDILANYTKTTANIVEVESKLKLARKQLETFTKKYKEVGIMYNRYKQSDYLRKKMKIIHGKIYWFNVQVIEEKIKNYETNVIKYEHEISQSDQRITQFKLEIENSKPKRELLEVEDEKLKSELVEVKQKYDSLKQAKDNTKEHLRQVGTEIKEKEQDIQDFTKNIERNNSSIKQEEKRLEEKNGGSKDKLIKSREELLLQRTSLTAEKKDAKDELFVLENTKEPSMNRLKRAEEAENLNFQALGARRRDLKNSQSDKYTAWGKNIDRILNDMKGVEFHKPPIGPIGIFVEVKEEYSNWKPLLNSILSKALDSFLVCDEHDRRILTGILQQHRVVKNIIVRKFESFNFDSGKVRNQTTFLDMLNVSDENVLYTLVDLNNIEKQIITKDERNPFDLVKIQNVMNVYSLFNAGSGRKSSSNRNTSRLDPVYYQRGLSKFSSASESNTKAIQDIEQQMQESQNKLKSLRSEYNKAKQEHQQKIEAYRDKIKSIDRQISITDQRVRELENKLDEDGDLEKIEQLKAQISHYESQITINEGIVASMKEDVEVKVIEYQHIKRETSETANLLADLRKRKESLEEALINLETEDETNENKVKHYEFEKSKRETLIEQATAKIIEGNSKLTPLVEEALEKCDRSEVLISESDDQNSIRNEYTEIQNQIQSAEEQIGRSWEEVQNELEDAMEKRDAASAAVERLSLTYRRLDSELNVRFEFLNTTIHSNVNQACRTFERSMELRGFKGNLRLDYSKKSLTLLVKTRNDDEKRTVDSLSGGEKSFSQIALLLSIWKVMDSRIRGLDEFDVYMDSVNRSISIKLLLSELRQYPKSQNIFITPQDIAVVGDLQGDNVRIHKMSDPRSDN
jgi:chromosome segregation ATPase